MQTTTKKVKEGTRGQKQIVTENLETLQFYKKMPSYALVFYVVCMIIFSTFRTADILFTIFAVIVYTGSYKCMAHISKPRYLTTGHLVHSGIDLNIDGGIAEHLKDLIILTTGCQLLSLYSNYFWLLWLLVPVRGMWILWTNILSPCIFQQGPSDPEMDEKKRKKLERQMRRQ